MKTKSLLIICIVTILGCQSATLYQLKPAIAKPENCHIELYASETEVPGKFETLCIVEAKTGTGMIQDRSANAAINEARPKLCECGAEAAIVIEATSREGTLSNLFTPVWDMSGRAKLKGIRFIH